MDLALNNLQRLICNKTQQTNQPSKKKKSIGIYDLKFSFVVLFED